MRQMTWITMMVLAGAAWGAEVDGKSLVKAGLIADVEGARPGGTFVLGVRYEVAPGWHIYWKHSGDTGMATGVRFQLPKGFEASEVRWPAPRRFVSPGPLVDFGYEGSAVLSVVVKAPDDLKVGQVLEFAAETEWLVCREQCLPGEGRPTLRLRVVEEARPANAEVFERLREELPVDAQADGSPVKASYGGSLETGALTVQLEWKDPAGAPGEVDFCPEPGEALAVSGVEVEKAASPAGGAGHIIRLKARALKGKSPGEVLPAVVAWTDARGIRRGVSLRVPLAAVK